MSIPGNANPLLLASAAADAAAAGPIKSVRFNDDDSGYLGKTLSSSGNRRTYTISLWTKRGNLGKSFQPFIANPNSSGVQGLYFDFSSDYLNIQEYTSGLIWAWQSAAVYRDPNAWYHVVAAIDTTQATDSNRIKMYINGVQITDFYSGYPTWPTQNLETNFNNNTFHAIGRLGSVTTGDYYFDGYMADFYFIDGQQLDPTSFGAFDDNGVWQAAAYSGTFGTNGFHLFDFANESGIGNDSSGNNNDFTVNNISLPDAGTPVSSATGAKPIFATTDGFGQTVGTGLATDDDASDLELCAPLTDGSGAASMTDRSPTGRTSSALTLTNNSSSSITVDTSTGNFYGESLNFSGTHSGVDVDGIGIWNSNFTLEGWFRRTGTGVYPTLFDTWYGQTSGVGFYLWWDGTNIDVVKDSSTYYHGGSGTTLPLNTWQHIALTRNGTTIKIYVDGTEYSSFTPSDSTWTSTKLRIGDAVSNGNPFVGQIQDVRAYSGLKYTGNFTVPAEPVSSANDDVLFDVPTNGTQSDTGAGGEVSGNYCTMNPLRAGVPTNPHILSNGNLDIDHPASDAWSSAYGTLAASSGQWYWEQTWSEGLVSIICGIGNELAQVNNYPADTHSLGYYFGNGDIYTGISGLAGSHGTGLSVGDVLGVALDVDAGTVDFYKNGSKQGSTITHNITGHVGPLVSSYSGKLTMNFGQRPFAYSAPSGYKALCTTNLPTPTIADGSDYFEAKTFTSNNGSQSITLGFSPDLVWTKSRSSSYEGQIFDAVRGDNQEMSPNATRADRTLANSLTFDSSGFTMGTNNNANYGTGGSSVAWAWDAGANSSKTFTVKVVSDSGNKYRFDDFGTSAVTLDLEEGSTYVFDQSDSSNSGHPLRFSTTSDGTHNSGSEYTTGVTAAGTPGSAGAKTTIVVASGAPTLYYYCSVHSGMGGQANTNSTAGASNFDGSIQSTVRANQAAGFSIISVSVPSISSATIGHGLNTAPAVYIWKDRDTDSTFWYVYHSSLSAAQFLTLSGTGPAATATTLWNNTAPTSSVINIGSALSNSGSAIIYAMAPVAGYSAFGSYTGNGNADGPFVFLGFKPALVILKRSDATASWYLYDYKRDGYNAANKLLYPNLTNAEANNHIPDFLSNGFKIRTTGTVANGNGNSYIYLAWAENPFSSNGGLAR